MKIIVFDDDPTGSQTVHDCLLLLKWDYETLLKGIQNKSKLMFILCDTRALSEKDAGQRLTEICASLIRVINNEGYSIKDFIFISRGDSTLRGHNFLEPQIINKHFGPFDATFHIPAFIEGNRVTIHGDHFVNNIPSHETIFAKDKIFGYETNNIKKLLHQKSNSKVELDDIKNLYLKDINALQIDKKNEIFTWIRNLKNNTQVIVDAENYFHLEKFCSAITELNSKKKFLFRTAASFISSYSKVGVNLKDTIYFSQLRRKNNKNEYMRGLIFVGSHIELTSIQLRNLLQISSCKSIELNVKQFYKLFKLKDKESQIKLLKNELLKKIRDLIKKDFTPVLYTSREVILFKEQDEECKFNRALSSFMAQLISELKNEIGYLISKGGITSNAILSEGFKINLAYLEGQIVKGISVLNISLESNHALIPVVTFPGNIGEDDTMQKLWCFLENKKLK